jgi:hypothetical protein
MPGFFGRGRKEDDPAPEPTQVLGDTPFEINRGSKVKVQVFYNQHSNHLASVTIQDLLLTEVTAIVGQDLGNGTVHGVLDSDARKGAVGTEDPEELKKAECDLAFNFVGRQALLGMLTERKVWRGEVVRIVLTAPTSSLLAS